MEYHTARNTWWNPAVYDVDALGAFHVYRSDRPKHHCEFNKQQ